MAEHHSFQSRSANAGGRAVVTPDNGARPVRLQLSRRKGFNLQRLSIETNGLPAVNVSRPGKWGNPYRVGDHPGGDQRHKPMTVADAVERFRDFECGPAQSAEIARELRGKNLACFCALGSPCHADVLLELAAAPVCEPVE